MSQRFAGPLRPWPLPTIVTPVIELNPSDVKPVSAALPAARLIDDSLDIPDFLRRRHSMRRCASPLDGGVANCVKVG
jgi:hypothetical protein